MPREQKTHDGVNVFYQQLCSRNIKPQKQIYTEYNTHIFKFISATFVLQFSGHAVRFQK